MGYCRTYEAPPHRRRPAIVSFLFVIEDEGIGIPADHIPRLTDRFYRVEHSRSKAGSTKTTSGFGLGLSLVQTIIELHHGTMTLTSEVGKGTQVEIII